MAVLWVGKGNSVPFKIRSLMIVFQAKLKIQNSVPNNRYDIRVMDRQATIVILMPV